MAANSGTSRKSVIACAECRRKKVRCSGERPACTHCLKSGIQCKYPIVKSKGARFTYNDILLKRLNRMKTFLKNTCYTPKHNLSNDNNDLNVTPSYDTFPIQNSTATDGCNTYQSEKTNIPVKENIVEEQNVVADERRNSNSNSYTILLEINVPSLSIVIHLVELFFIHIHDRWYSFLHKPSFLERIKQGQVNTSLLLAICGVSARFSNHPQLMSIPRHFSGDDFIDEARKLVSQEYDEPNLETLQTLIILVVHDFLSLNGGKAAINSAIAARMSTALSLNRKETYKGLSWVEQETCRRTWWSAVIMDRLANIGPNRPHILSELNADIPLPCSLHNYMHGIPTLMPKFSGEYPSSEEVTMFYSGDNNTYLQFTKESLDIIGYHVKSLILLGKVSVYANNENLHSHDDFPPWSPLSKFGELVKEIDDFYNSLPPSIIYSKMNLLAHTSRGESGYFAHLHVIIQMCYVALYRIVYPYNHATFSRFSVPSISFLEKSANKLTAAACSISVVVHQIMQVDEVLPAPFLGFCAYTTSYVHLANSFSKVSETKNMAKHYLATNLRCLVLLREHWDIAVTWCAAIKERYMERLKQRDDRLNGYEINQMSGIDYDLDYNNKGNLNANYNKNQNGSQNRNSELDSVTLPQDLRLPPLQYGTLFTSKKLLVGNNLYNPKAATDDNYQYNKFSKENREDNSKNTHVITACNKNIKNSNSFNGYSFTKPLNSQYAPENNSIENDYTNSNQNNYSNNNENNYANNNHNNQTNYTNSNQNDNAYQVSINSANSNVSGFRISQMQFPSKNAEVLNQFPFGASKVPDGIDTGELWLKSVENSPHDLINITSSTISSQSSFPSIGRSPLSSDPNYSYGSNFTNSVNNSTSSLSSTSTPTSIPLSSSTLSSINNIGTHIDESDQFIETKSNINNNGLNSENDNGNILQTVV